MIPEPGEVPARPRDARVVEEEIVLRPPLDDRLHLLRPNRPPPRILIRKHPRRPPRHALHDPRLRIALRAIRVPLPPPLLQRRPQLLRQRLDIRLRTKPVRIQLRHRPHEVRIRPEPRHDHDGHAPLPLPSPPHLPDRRLPPSSCGRAPAANGICMSCKIAHGANPLARSARTSSSVATTRQSMSHRPDDVAERLRVLGIVLHDQDVWRSVVRGAGEKEGSGATCAAVKRGRRSRQAILRGPRSKMTVPRPPFETPLDHPTPRVG